MQSFFRKLSLCLFLALLSSVIFIPMASKAASLLDNTKVKVHLSQPMPGGRVESHRTVVPDNQADYPGTIPFREVSPSDFWYESDRSPSRQWPWDACKNASDAKKFYTYDLTVFDKDNVVVGRGSVCVQAPSVSIDITVTPAGADTGKMFGNISINDVTDTDPNKAAKAPKSWTLILNNESTGGRIPVLGSAYGTTGSYSLGGIPPGTYTASLGGTYVAKNPPKDSNGKSTGDQPFSTTVTGIVIKTGDNPRDFSGIVGSTTDAGGGNADAACDAGAITFIICPVIEAMNAGINVLKDLAVEQLKFTPLSLDPNYPAQKIWSTFRDLANVILIFIFFVIIFGTGLGLDNYTVKRALPRLIIAAIIVQFSYLLMAVAVDGTNVLGGGIGTIVTSIQGGGAGQHWSAGVMGVVAGVAVIGVGGAAAVAVAIGAAIPVLLGVFAAFLGIICVYLTLQIRLMIIYVLVVVSPIAIALWVLPNTESIFQKWRKMLIGLLMMYPLIVLLFLAGNLLSIIVPQDKNASAVQRIIASLAPIAVLFLMPMTYKFGGQLFNWGAGLSSKFTKGIGNKAQSAFNSKEDQERRRNRQLERYNSLEGQTGLRARVNRQMAGRGSGFGWRAGGGRFTDERQGMRARAAAAKEFKERMEMENYRITTTNPDELAAGASAAISAGNHAQAAAYIQRLGQTPPGREHLRQIRQEMRGSDGLMSAGSQQAWTAGTESNRQAISGGAPDLLRSIERNPVSGQVEDHASDAFNSATGQQVSNYDPATAARFAEHLNGSNTQLTQARTAASNADASLNSYRASNPTDNSSTAYTQLNNAAIQARSQIGTLESAVNRGNSAVAQVMGSQRLRDSMSQQSIASLQTGYGTYNPDGSVATADTNFLTPQTRAAIARQFDVNGNVVPPPTPTPTPTPPPGP